MWIRKRIIDVSKSSLKSWNWKNSKQFAKSLKRQSRVFVLICANVVKTRNKKSSSIKILEQIENLRIFFYDVKIDILLEQDRRDHAIDLIENKKSSYMSLYNLSQKKVVEISTLYRKCFNQRLNQTFDVICKCFHTFCTQKERKLAFVREL